LPAAASRASAWQRRAAPRALGRLCAGRPRETPLSLSFVLIGFFIWAAENLGTFFGIWRYPNQRGAWSVVHVGKWRSSALLVIMTFTIATNLKHVKARIYGPP
jgi:uncharacterized membrane protein YoaT (DUF817 family)